MLLFAKLSTSNCDNQPSCVGIHAAAHACNKITHMPSRMQCMMNDLNARGIVAVAPSKPHDGNCRTRKWFSRPNCVGTHTASKSRQRRCYCRSRGANVRQLGSTLPLLLNRHRSNEPDSATSCRSKLCTRPSSPNSEAACSLSHN